MEHPTISTVIIQSLLLLLLLPLPPSVVVIVGLLLPRPPRFLTVTAAHCHGLPLVGVIGAWCLLPLRGVLGFLCLHRRRPLTPGLIIGVELAFSVDLAVAAAAPATSGADWIQPPMRLTTYSPLAPFGFSFPLLRVADVCLGHICHLGRLACGAAAGLWLLLPCVPCQQSLSVNSPQ